MALVEIISPALAAVDIKETHLSVFVGGGITNCADWQADFKARMEERLKESPTTDVILYNPRRPDWDINDRSNDQIVWEFNRIHNDTDVMVFWFAPETMCPITLYELGSVVRSHQIIVGCHPNYQRRFDVIEQLKLVRPDVVVLDSVTDLADATYKFATTRTPFF